MSSPKEIAEKTIDDHPVVVFSKSYCPHCVAAKQLLSTLGANFYVVELDQIPQGNALQDALEQITGQRTVPNIFIGKKHIGGNSDLQALKGSLPTLLKEAGAL